MSPWMKGLVDNSASAQLRVWGRRRMLEALLMILCGLAILGGLSFIAVGGYLSLRLHYAPWLSGLIVGAILLLLATGTALLTRRCLRADVQPAPSAPAREATPQRSGQAQIDNAEHLGEVIGRHVSRKGIRSTDVLLAALAAGTVLSAAPALRRRRRQPRQT